MNSVLGLMNVLAGVHIKLALASLRTEVKRPSLGLARELSLPGIRHVYLRQADGVGHSGAAAIRRVF